MLSPKKNLENFLINYLLFSGKNNEIITLYYNKSFSMVTSVLSPTDVDNFLQNYLDQFDDNLVFISKSGKKKNIIHFIKVIDYCLVTENGEAVK